MTTFCPSTCAHCGIANIYGPPSCWDRKCPNPLKQPSAAPTQPARPEAIQHLEVVSDAAYTCCTCGDNILRTFDTCPACKVQAEAIQLCRYKAVSTGDHQHRCNMAALPATKENARYRYCTCVPKSILAHLFAVANARRNAALTAAGFDAYQVPIETPEVVAATAELAAVCRALDGACEDCLCYPCVCPDGAPF